MVSGCHQFLKQAIWYCIIEVYGFFGIQSLTKEPGGKGKWWIFWNLPSLLGTSLSRKHIKSGNDKTWKMCLVTKLLLNLSSIFLKLTNAKDRLRDKMYAFDLWFPSHIYCRKSITIWSLNESEWCSNEDDQALVWKKDRERILS